MTPPSLASREDVREHLFNEVWTRELNSVFADVAPYYDRANYVASLGLWGWFRTCFLDTVELTPGQRVLDVCAGTNAIGIGLLEREPTLDVPDFILIDLDPGKGCTLATLARVALAAPS